MQCRRWTVEPFGCDVSRLSNPQRQRHGEIPSFFSSSAPSLTIFGFWVVTGAPLPLVTSDRLSKLSSGGTSKAVGAPQVEVGGGRQLSQKLRF